MNAEINQTVLELTINSPIAKVWDIMLNQTSNWWPKDFLVTGAEKMIMEPYAGGRLYEANESGAEVLWGNIISIVPEKQIEFAGFISPDYGGPSVNFTKMAIEPGETDDQTKFRLTNTSLGNKNEEGQEEMNEGWKYLFGAFKSFCEN